MYYIAFIVNVLSFSSLKSEDFQKMYNYYGNCCPQEEHDVTVSHTATHHFQSSFISSIGGEVVLDCNLN